MAAKDGTLSDSASIRKRKREKLEGSQNSRSRKRRSRARHSKINEKQNNGPATTAQGAGRTNDDLSLREGRTALPLIEGKSVMVNSRRAERAPEDDASIDWRVSEPMGGRMLDIDPIFSPDEKHVILTYNASVQVYSTADSLLIRRIAIPILEPGDAGASTEPYIVASSLSKVTPDFVWVACSDGRVWYIDWTSGSGADHCFHTKSCRLLDLSVESMMIGKELRDLVITSEKVDRQARHIVAYDRDAFAERCGTILYTGRDGVIFLKLADGGRIIAGATKKGIILGMLSLDKRPLRSLTDVKYQFYSFETSDIISCLDLRLSSSGGSQHGGQHHQSADLVVGCARGAILLYQDVPSIFQIGTAKSSRKRSLQHRVYHWHRRAVHSVKWSRDGNYLISGGSEQVLVLWQLDTGKRDLLPHLSGAIENIVVSPHGSSYALHLDDNSSMVISTAELKPVAYVSGFQSPVADHKPSKESLVRRVGQRTAQALPPLVGTISPVDPSRLLLCVGSGQQATVAGGVPSTPSLQIFDLDSFRSVAKHSIARTNHAESNTTTQGYPIHEPRVTHMAYSNDGRWLATVDEWQPPERDFENIVDGPNNVADLAQERREVFLKFWDAGEGDMSLSLVTRINEVHFTDKSEPVFDLAADKTSTRFATVGDDGMVRLWSPKLRRRDGLAATGEGNRAMRTWRCTQVIQVGESLRFQEDITPSFRSAKTQRSGALVFSEDGSSLFVAFGGSHDAVVYIIDTEAGEVRHVLQDMFSGRVRGIKTMASQIIILSDDLRVYDIVADQLRYGVQLCAIPEHTAQLAQLAVDDRSRTFAVVVPCKGSSQQGTSSVVASELAIFSTSESQPRLVKKFSQAITSLLPAGHSSGFVVIDSAAQIWSVQPGTELGAFARPLSDLRLDEGEAPEEEAGRTAGLLLHGEDDGPSDDEMQDAGDENEDEDYNVHPAVLAPQRLTEIFDAAPAFALPPIEELFYQVTGLLSSRPVSGATA